MSEQRDYARDKLDRLSDLLVEDIINTSDEEILAEFRKEGGDPEQLANEMRALFERTVSVANMRELAPANATIDTFSTTAKIIEWPIKLQQGSSQPPRKNWSAALRALLRPHVLAYIAPTRLSGAGFSFSVIVVTILASVAAWLCTYSRVGDLAPNARLESRPNSQVKVGLAPDPNPLGPAGVGLAVDPNNILGPATIAAATAWLSSRSEINETASNFLPQPSQVSGNDKTKEVKSRDVFSSAMDVRPVPWIDRVASNYDDVPAGLLRCEGWLRRTVGCAPGADRDEAFASTSEMGNVEFVQGRFDSALRYYNEAILLKPYSALAFNNRGDVYFAKGKYDLAIADYDQALKRAPTSALTFNNLADAHFAKNDFDQAISDYDRAISLDSKRAIAYNNRGRAYLKLAEYEKALSDLMKSTKLDPSQAVAFANIGDVYSALGYSTNKVYAKSRFALAVAAYNRAISLEPSRPIWVKDRATLYSLIGQNDLADVDLNKLFQAYMATGAAAISISEDLHQLLSSPEYQSWLVDYYGLTPRSMGLSRTSAGGNNQIESWLILGLEHALRSE